MSTLSDFKVSDANSGFFEKIPGTVYIKLSKGYEFEWYAISEKHIEKIIYDSDGFCIVFSHPLPPEIFSWCKNKILYSNCFFEPNKNNTLLWLTDPISNFRCFKCKVLYEKELCLDSFYKEESISSLESDNSIPSCKKDSSYSDSIPSCKKDSSYSDSIPSYKKDSSYSDFIPSCYKKDSSYSDSIPSYKKDSSYSDSIPSCKKDSSYSDSIPSCKKESFDKNEGTALFKSLETKFQFMNPTILLIILTFSLMIDWASPIICIMIIYLGTSLGK